MTRLRRLVTMVLIVLCSLELAGRSVAPPVFLYASRSDQIAIDQDDHGGNPFATALVGVLSRKNASFQDLKSGLIDETHRASSGRQSPEIVGDAHLSDCQFLPKPAKQKWVALVVVFSDYTASSADSLPGAKHDRERIEKALSRVGFAVTAVLDPDRRDLERRIQDFAAASARADVAVVYTTGHGVELRGAARILLPFARIDGRRWVTVSELAASCRAAKANLVFYGACRTRYPQ